MGHPRGAQVRLAALAMLLGEVSENLERSDSAGQIRTLVSAARRNAIETLAELRDLARGIHPAALDRGLAAALGSLADTVSIPVELSVRTSVRQSAAIEAIAYFLRRLAARQYHQAQRREPGDDQRQRRPRRNADDGHR